MSINPRFDFSHLTPAERIQLAVDLWNSVYPEEADWTLTEAQRAELQRRLDEDDPGADEDWGTFRDGLLRRPGVSADDPGGGRV